MAKNRKNRMSTSASSNKQKPSKSKCALDNKTELKMPAKYHTNKAKLTFRSNLTKLMMRSMRSASQSPPWMRLLNYRSIDLPNITRKTPMRRSSKSVLIRTRLSGSWCVSEMTKYPSLFHQSTTGATRSPTKSLKNKVKKIVKTKNPCKISLQ